MHPPPPRIPQVAHLLQLAHWYCSKQSRCSGAGSEPSSPAPGCEADSCLLHQQAWQDFGSSPTIQPNQMVVCLCLHIFIPLLNEVMLERNIACNLFMQKNKKTKSFKKIAGKWIWRMKVFLKTCNYKFNCHIHSLKGGHQIALKISRHFPPPNFLMQSSDWTVTVKLSCFYLFICADTRVEWLWRALSFVTPASSQG